MTAIELVTPKEEKPKTKVEALTAEVLAIATTLAEKKELLRLAVAEEQKAAKEALTARAAARKAAQAALVRPRAPKKA